jgi:hypothetical protein
MMVMLQSHWIPKKQVYRIKISNMIEDLLNYFEKYHHHMKNL